MNDRDDFAPAVRKLLDVFEYIDGKLYRKSGQFKGVAGSVHHTGYEQVKVGNKNYRSHRVIFAMHHGYFPAQIDHIDGNKLNNKIENLREANAMQNQHNVGLTHNNKTGVKNVVWYRNRWRVYMRINKKPKHIGSFKDLELAELVAIEARNKFQGDYVNHG